MLKVFTPTETLISSIKKINFYKVENYYPSEELEFNRMRSIEICSECSQTKGYGHLSECPVYWIENSIKKLEAGEEKINYSVSYSYTPVKEDNIEIEEK